jgi:anti-repressor protein
MEELIKYSTLEMRLFGNDEVNSVSLRELYNDLGYDNVNFVAWCKRNLEAKFEEHSDWERLFLEKESKHGGKGKVDYIITLDVDKHIAMSSDKPKGFEIRKYFIEVEKMARKELQMTPLQLMEKANQMLLVENAKKAREIEFKKKLLAGSETLIQNIADDLNDEEIAMEEYCQLLSSRATDTYLGRTKVYTLLRLMKLVKQGKTTPTQYATEVGYLKLRHHEYGVSTKVVREKMSKLTAKIIKYLLNNEDVNESLGFPFHPELRD